MRSTVYLDQAKRRRQPVLPLELSQDLRGLIPWAIVIVCLLAMEALSR